MKFTPLSGDSRRPPDRQRKRLIVELLVIDLETCERCVPTQARLDAAILAVAPAARELGIEIEKKVAIVTSAHEALAKGLKTSPTIRINGRDIDADMRESPCASCGALSGEGAEVDCREWHYKGKVYSAAPLPLLVEVLLRSMLDIDSLPPIEPPVPDALPDNLVRFFSRSRKRGCCE